MSDTLRSHLEAQERLAHDAESGKTLVWGDNPDDYFRTLDRILREIQEHAVAALAILPRRFALVDDETLALLFSLADANTRTPGAPELASELLEEKILRSGVLHPDPVPVVSPRPNQQETP